MNISTIFWDWNGTLLDDVEACVDSMNELLTKRGMPSITVDSYKELFGFPVINYYHKLGFTFENETFEVVSVEFIEGYNKRVQSVGLQKSAIELLEHYKAKGVRQVIISAMEQNMLENLLSVHNITEYFDDVKGLSDIYARGKHHLAEDYIQKHNLNPSDIFFIGDTLHDAEVAESIGCNLVLVANGHHSFNKLSVNGFKVIYDLSELKSSRMNHNSSWDF